MARAFLPAGFGGEQPKRKRAKYGGRRKGARNRIAKLAGSRMIDAHGEQGDLQSWRQPFPTRAFAVGTPDAISSYFDSADDFPAAAEAGKSALTAP